MLVLSLAIGAGEYVEMHKKIENCETLKGSLLALASGCPSTVAIYLAKQK